MNAVKLNRIVLTLCGLFSLLVVVIGTTGVAHAVAGAQSSASVTVDPFNDPRITRDRETTEAITTATSQANFVINSTQRSAWEDVMVESSITDRSYDLSTATASSSGPTVAQLSLALSETMGYPVGYSANAQSLHDVDFTFNGAGGNVIASAVYDILLQAYRDTAGDSASGYVLAGIYLRNITQLTEASDVINLNFTTITVPDNFITLEGPLSATLAFATGDYGSFRVIVDGNATAVAAPEPSTLALLGLGLVGAAMLRKRNRN